MPDFSAMGYAPGTLAEEMIPSDSPLLVCEEAPIFRPTLWIVSLLGLLQQLSFLASISLCAAATPSIRCSPSLNGSCDSLIVDPLSVP